MANERSADLILRAQVDQALQPLAQVTQRVKDLVAVLAQQQAAAKSGDTSLGEYAKALKDVEKASGDLLKARSALDNFATRQATLDAKTQTVDVKRQARDDFSASLPGQGERTTAQETALKRLNTALASSERQASTAAIAYEKAVSQLQRLGVLTDQLAASQQRLRLDQAGADISGAVLQAAEALKVGQAQNDILIATLRNAGVEKQVAAQRATDAARFVADQEKERLAVLAAAEAVRVKGAAAQTAVNTGTAHNQRQADIEAAFATDDAEKKLASDRATAARAFQADQFRLLEAVTSVWEAEDAGAAKARISLEAFRGEVAKAVAQVRSGLANAASQTGALGAPVAVAAPTIASQVRTALAPPPGPGADLSSLGGLQSELTRIASGVTAAGGGIHGYTQELKNLDAVSRELVRQSQIVDSFQKQDRAARDAVAAFRDAVLELHNLELAARNATPENLSEVTSQIAAKNRQIGSIESGSGLAAQARTAQEALAKETLAVNAIGLAADEARAAETRLTASAIAASEIRKEALVREKAAADAEVAATLARASALSTAPVASTSARSAVGAVGGVGRSQDIADISDAIDKLETKLNGVKQTAQGFNRTMDQLFAVQRQIASDATLIDSFTAQQAAVIKATTAFQNARAELDRIATAVKAGTADMTSLRAAELALTGAAGDLSKQIGQQQQLDLQLKTRKIDTANLTTEVTKLTTSAERLNVVQQKAQSSSGTVFGLSAYQLENLSFQVNDVITQLSLGQGVLRTFESQAGQIFQVFETSISAMYKLFIYALPAAAALGVLVLAFERLQETIGAQRGFSAKLAGTVDATAHTAASLVKLQREVEKTGIDFTEAGTAINEFLDKGLSTERITQFTKTARDLSLGLGESYVDVSKKLATLPDANAEGIRKLLLGYQALNPQLDLYIQEQEKSGNLDFARAAAFAALTARAAEAAKEGIGPLLRETIALKDAWHNLLDTVGGSQGFTSIIEQFREIAALTSALVTTFRSGFSKESLSALKDLVDGFNKGKLGDPGFGPFETQRLKVIQLQLELAKAKKLNDDLHADPGTAFTTAATRAARDVAKINDELQIAIDKRDKLANGRPLEIAPEGGPTSVPGVSPGVGRTAADTAQAHLGETASQVAPFLTPEKINPVIDAWCAAFANAALASVGISGTGSNVATSFEKWGDAVATASVKRGDILVQARGHAAGETGGHVGIATGETRVGPNGGLLVEMISGNSGGQVRRGFEDASTLDVRRANGQFVPPTSGLADPKQAGLEATANRNEQERLQDQRDSQRDATLRGNSEARIAQDVRLAALEDKRIAKEAEQARSNAQENAASIALRGQLSADYRANQKAERDKEDRADQQALENSITAVQKIVDAKALDPDARRRVVDEQFVKPLQDLQDAVAKGVTQLRGTPIAQLKEQILALRDQAREAATLLADHENVTNVVKARDAQVSAIEGDLKTGTITLQEAFSRVAAVVKAFGPQITAAVAASNADLAKQPSSPKVVAQQAANDKIDARGDAAATSIDAAAQAKLDQIIAARNDKVKEYNDLVSQGALTQRQADERSIEAYNKARPQLQQLSAAFKDQLQTQRDLGQISQETYDAMAAKIDKALAASNDLTASQKAMGKAIDDSIVNHAIAAFDTITTAIGAAIAGTGTWADAIKSLGVGFAQFAAGVLQDIAKMIIKQELLNALQSATAGTSIGGFFSKLAGGGAAAGAGAAGAAGAVGGETGAFITSEGAAFAIAHAGGIAGSFTQSRRVDPRLFVGAPRAHSGAMVGLGANEVPTILQTGEEVITAKDGRHRNNMRPDSNPVQTSGSIRNIVLLDESEIAGAMAGSHGERVVFSHIKRNAPTIRQLLGVK